MKIDQQLLDKAKQIVLQYNNYSPSFLQRKLQIGYGLAASLIDAIMQSSDRKEDAPSYAKEVISVVDSDTIMKQEGYVVGYHGCALIENVIKELQGKLGDNLSIAKGMSIRFYMNKDMLMSILRNVYDKIESLSKYDIDIVYNIEVNNEIHTDRIEYEILLNGMCKL